MSVEYPDYQWDPDKAKSNYLKHGIYFADAVFVLEDDMGITIPDDCTEEKRFVTIGMDALLRILVVVYTWREDNIRIISARKASPAQREQYEEVKR